MRDAELYDQLKHQHLPLADYLKLQYYSNPSFVWQIIWINLSYNSKVIQFYLDNYMWESEIHKDGITQDVAAKSYQVNERGLRNIINELFGLFKKTPIGNELRIGIPIGDNKTQIISKKGDPLLHSDAIFYSLNRYCHDKGSFSFEIEELFSKDTHHGPYYEFGISRPNLEKHLRWLQENRNRFINVDLNAGLQNVVLDQSFRYDTLLNNF